MTDKPSYIKPKRAEEDDLPTESEEARLARDLIEAKAAKSAAEDLVKEANKAIDACEQALIPLMQARGIDLFRIEGLGTFSTSVKNHPKVENDEVFIPWLDDNGINIAKRTVHPSTLKGFINDWLGEGRALPPGVSNFTQTKINTRKA